MFNVLRREVIICFVDIGRIVDHQSLEVIVRFVDIGKIVDHHCLEVIVSFFDNGGILDHHCLEVIVWFVDRLKLPTHSGFHNLFLKWFLINKGDQAWFLQKIIYQI